jgi:hypothetical protein
LFAAAERKEKENAALPQTVRTTPIPNAQRPELLYNEGRCSTASLFR